VSVQAAHAAIEAARHIPAEDEHPHLVICGVPDEATLVREQARLESFDLRCFPFYEADRGDELTALSIGPLREPSARRRLSRYQLLKGE
jgi:hypothetical protein